MIREIQAKTILSHSKEPDPWFGIHYTMNIYRGCEHQCIYCDSRSECYQIETFTDVLVKVNAIELLEKELPRKRKVGVIGTGSMSDPYTPAEKRYGLTRRALEVIARCHFPLHAITKSDMVVRDLDLLEQINQVYAAVSFTITTSDDDLARRLEPGAPSPSARLEALRILTEKGIVAGVTLMPLLPFIEDTPENVIAIVEKARQCGARYILPWFGMTLRDRQRAHFYRQLDRLFPGVRQKYQAAYGEKYSADVPEAKSLYSLFERLCRDFDIPTRMPFYQPIQQDQQLKMPF